MEMKMGEEGKGMSSTEQSVIQKSAYARKKTVAEGLLDVGLLVANASQLKALLDRGESHDYYYVLLVLLVLSITVQVAIGLMLLFLGTTEGNVETDKRSNRMNNVVIGLIFGTMILNIIIGVFGVSV
ncbi:ninjurin-2-like [Ostrea edulis]|uniref:ninjurin-2-like n=1 Tax=Ostrea edulis TaxID=37623 RepID=UPI002095C969|nr:ninjurin-2-like [Ostrea edulis]